MKAIISTKKWLTFILPLAIVDIFTATIVAYMTYFDLAPEPFGINLPGIIAYYAFFHTAVLAIGCLAVMWLNKDSFYQKLAWTRLILFSLIVPTCMNMVREFDVMAITTSTVIAMRWIPLLSYAAMIPLMLKHESVKAAQEK